MNRFTRYAYLYPLGGVLLLSVACAVGPNTRNATMIGGEPQITSASATSTIKGTVSLEGADLSGYEVTAVPVSSVPGVKTYSTAIDHDGRFSVAVPGGTYNLIASKPGSNFRAVKWSVQSATSVDLVLTPTGTIAGTVTADPATDLAGTFVYVPGTSFMAALDAGGKFSMTGVPVGTVALAVHKPGYSGGALAAVAVAAGQTTANQNMTLKPAPSSAFAAVSGLPPAGQAGAVYVGEATCVTCHSDVKAAYEATAHWKVTAPGSTWSGMTRGTGCLGCHVAGEDPANPKTSIKINGVPAGADFTKGITDAANAKFLGIQCENCHGPGGNHVGATANERSLTITKTPSYKMTCARCHINGSYNQQMPASGATDADVNKGGYGALPHHPQDLVYSQNGGYEFGLDIPASAHNTQLGNGCINCHTAGSYPDNHALKIDKAKAIQNVCSKCHGPDFKPDSISNFQGSFKIALEGMHELLVKYKTAFCQEVSVATSSTQLIPFSTAAADIENLSNKCSTWDDSPDAIKSGFPHQSGANPISSTESTWSPHQKTFNRAHWNWDLLEAEKSFGIHAPAYEQALLRNTWNALATDLGTGSYSLMSVR